MEIETFRRGLLNAIASRDEMLIKSFRERITNLGPITRYLPSGVLVETLGLADSHYRHELVDKIREEGFYGEDVLRTIDLTVQRAFAPFKWQDELRDMSIGDLIQTEGAFHTLARTLGSLQTNEKLILEKLLASSPQLEAVEK